jgi:methionyl-tRNA formyltransferase
VTVIDSIASGTARAEPQQGDVTLAPKLTVADGLLDWNRPAVSLDNQIRGVTPEPGASAIVDGARLKILTAFVAHELPRLDPGEFAFVDNAVLVGTATDPIELVTVHPAGRKAMDAASWWRGRSATDRSTS